MEQALSDIQHRLSAKTDELHAAHETVSQLEASIGDLNPFFDPLIASARCVGTA